MHGEGVETMAILLHATIRLLGPERNTRSGSYLLFRLLRLDIATQVCVSWHSEDYHLVERYSSTAVTGQAMG